MVHLVMIVNLIMVARMEADDDAYEQSPMEEMEGSL